MPMTTARTAHRFPTLPIQADEPGMGVLEIFPLPTGEAFLFDLMKDLFENWWREIQFGILIQGAAWELKLSEKPRYIGLLDGYVTIDFGGPHCHICIGPHKGSSKNPVSPALAKHRRCARAELYRQLHNGKPNSWGLRLYNGKDEQLLTVFLPNPFLSPEMKLLKQPDFSRLALWDHLLKSCLGLPPDPKDRTGTKFVHG